MTQIEMVEEFKRLSRDERLVVIMAILQLVQDDLQQIVQPTDWAAADAALEAAAQRMLPYYLHDKELTAFSVLDSEDFLD